MFKIESYITPYILAYLDKYFTNFNPANFQVSLWSGGASFNNLDLNLEVLEQEFDLPVKLLSGHIHQLQICVPWTKITYEPIVVYVNTIEITMRLKKASDYKEAAEKSTEAGENEISKVAEEPPGYVQSLINKMIMNIRIECQNVILKIVEEDIVFTLNVKNATLAPTDEDWKACFVDLASNDYVLRRQIMFSDLTVCLDKTNSSGKIEQYLEPLLYKCSFELRLFQQYSNHFNSKVNNSIMDVYCENLKFTVTDEQIPMLLRLYNETITMNECHRQARAMHLQKKRSRVEKQALEDVQNYNDDYGMSWGTWGVSLVTSAAAVLVGGIEPEEEENEEEIVLPTTKLGIYAAKATILFKGMEAIAEQKHPRGIPRLTFQPFLKFSMQGMVLEMVQKHNDFNTFIGVSNILVEGIQTCPCGIRDCYLENTTPVASEYISVGEPNPNFASYCLFEKCTVTLPSSELFEAVNRAEKFTEEMMLAKTPAIAMEYLDVRQNTKRSMDDDLLGSESGRDETCDISFSKILCRAVVAPCNIRVCSGSMHRYKMILYAANAYQRDAALASDAADKPIAIPGLCVADTTDDVFQLTIIRPTIEIIAGDHLEFDERTHVRAKRKKRKTATLTPLSQIIPEWPSVTVTCNCLDSRLSYPSRNLQKMLGNNLPQKQTWLTKIFAAEAKIKSKEVIFPFLIPCNVDFKFQVAIQPNTCSQNSVISAAEFNIDDLRLNFAKPHLMILQIILSSCYDENLAHYFTSTSLLRDYATYQEGTAVLHLVDASYEAAFTSSVHSARFKLGSVGFFVNVPKRATILPVFEGSSSLEQNGGQFLVLTIQFPLCPNLNSSSPVLSTEKFETIPAISFFTDEFTCKIDVCFLRWLQYDPVDEPNRVPESSQEGNHIVQPMIPITRTSSRMSIISRAFSYSDVDLYGSVDGVTGNDFRRLYEIPDDISDGRSSSVSGANVSKTGDRSTIDPCPRKSCFQITYIPADFIYVWNSQYFVTSFTSRSFSFVRISKGSVYVYNTNANYSHTADRGLVIITPVISVQPESARSNIGTLFHSLEFPISILNEHTATDLYPLRITVENAHFATFREESDFKFLSQPINVVLTVTITEKPGLDDASIVHSAFIHSDISSVKFAVGFEQIGTIMCALSSVEDAVSLLHHGSTSLGRVSSRQASEKTGISLCETESTKQVKRRLDPATLGKDIFPQQHSTSLSLPELDVVEPEDGPIHFSTEPIQSSFLANKSFWFQLTVAQFQLAIIDTPHDGQLSVNQLVLEVEDITASLDIQEVFQKLSLKISATSLRNCARSSNDMWDTGTCIGIIFTSSDEITKDIKHLKGRRKRENSFDESVSGANSPVGLRRSSFQPNHSPAAHSSSSNRGFLTLTFTRVQAKNFHKKSDLQSPAFRWNLCLKKYCEKFEQSTYSPYENEESRFLSELDVKCGPMDVLLDISMLQRYFENMQRIMPPSRRRTKPCDEPSYIPVISNATVPLIYFISGPWRIFIRASQPQASLPSLHHDTIALEAACIKVDSQSENPLSRTVVDKTLHKLAEQTSILEVPGSPVEDRQYQLDLIRTTVYSLSWEALMINSRELTPTRNSILKTMGENPALEWNTTVVENIPRVFACPMLEIIDIGVSVAPAMVYQASFSDPSKCVIVAGSSIEVSVTTEANIYINLNQMCCIVGVGNGLLSVSTSSNPNESSKDTEGAQALNRECDSGIGSAAQNIDELKKSSEVPDAPIKPHLVSSDQQRYFSVPIDVLMTGFMFQIILYDLKERVTLPHDGIQDLGVSAIVPLSMIVIGQPHVVVSLSSSSQRVEFSMFDLSIGISASEKKVGNRFQLPDFHDFSDRMFDTMYGERNPKTGMVYPFMTVKCQDFISGLGTMAIDISRPAEFPISRRLIRTWLKIIGYLEAVDWPKADVQESSKPPPASPPGSPDPFKAVCGIPLASYFGSIAIKLNQISVKIVEEGTDDIPNCGITLGLTSITLIAMARKPKSSRRPEKLTANVKVVGVTIATSIGARRDILLTPWNVSLNIKSRWKVPHLPPCIAAAGTTDCANIRIGPQNILAITQLYCILGSYLNDFLAQQEDALEVILHEGPATIAACREEFEDDLRSGNFRYIQSENRNQIPGVYQIVFSESEKSMSWRYPHSRCLTRIESLPVPMDTELTPSSHQQKEVPCIVEYFDEVQGKFCHFGVLYLSETSKGAARVPGKECYHLFMASTWRIVISGSHGSTDLIKPELLAASLRIDSVQDFCLNPRVKCQIEISKIRINLLNQLTYAGRDSLKFYAQGGPSLSDHPFLSAEFSNIDMLATFWSSKCKFDITSYIHVLVTQFAYLTEATIVAPLNLQASYTYIQNQDCDSGRLSKIELVTKPLEIKLSSSILHALTISLLSWEQVLQNFNGNYADLSYYKENQYLPLTELVICNDLNSDILINQVRYDGELTPVHAVTCESVGCRECYAFIWPTSKASTRCKISVRDPDWKISDVVSFGNYGYQVVGIQKSIHKLFIQVKQLTASQKLISLFGPFSIANACEETMEVALLPAGGGREITFTIQPGTHGPSRLMNVEDLEHLRFRYTSDDHVLPWSAVLSIADLRKEKKLPLQFFKQNANGNLTSVSTWCCILHEEIQKAARYMVVIAPAFRIKSSLTMPTVVFSSVGRVLPDQQFELGGYGAEKQIEFAGNIEDTVRHLTFQSSLSNSPSTPPIPLNPNQLPASSNDLTSIDATLEEVYKKVTDPETALLPEDVWPFINDSIDIYTWLPCAQPETLVEVQFSPWIQGLPTVLVDLKPWALFINLTGQRFHYSDVMSTESFEIPSPSIFTPPKITQHFKIGYESKGSVHWSIPLQLSDEQSRLEIHEANSNGRIPFEGISFLEIQGVNEACFLTLEVRAKKSILVITFRPTFLVRNETQVPLKVSGVSLKMKRVQSAADWSNLDDFVTLESQDMPLINASGSKAAFTPLPIHASDSSKRNRSSDEEEWRAESAAYLSISCGGPWWFVQLFRFDRMFNYLSTPEGVNGRRIAATLPKMSPVENEPYFGRKLGVHDSSMPIVVSWTAKKGQVWVNISKDSYPQVLIHNLSDVPLFCAQASNIIKIPVPETENFDQYCYFPCNTRGYYAFPRQFSDFPTIVEYSEIQLPSLIMARLPQEPIPLSQKITDSLGFFSKTTMLYSGIFEWSKPIRIDGLQTSVQVVDALGVKVTVEHVGFSKVIYVENLSTVEVLAKDIRHRIQETQEPSQDRNSDRFCSTSQHSEHVKQSGAKVKKPEAASVAVMAINVCPKPLEAMVYIPWFRIIMLTDVNPEGFQYEVLSITSQDIVMERYSISNHTTLRSLNNCEPITTVLRVNVGDLQVDAPPYEGMKSDFAVVLRQDSDYIPIFSSPNEGFDLRSPLPLNLPVPCALLLECTSEFRSVGEFGLMRIRVVSQPLSLFLEKHFIENVLPVVDRIVGIVEERWLAICNMGRLPLVTTLTTQGYGRALPSLLAAIPSNISSRQTNLSNSSSTSFKSLLEDMKSIRTAIRQSKSTVDADSTQNIAESPDDGKDDASPRKEISNELADQRSTLHQRQSAASSKSLHSLHSRHRPGFDKYKHSPSIVTLIDDDSGSPLWYYSPFDVQNLLAEFGYPLRLQELTVSAVRIYASVRLKYGVYLAFDHAPVDFKEFKRNQVVTTYYQMGHDVGQHYWQNVLFSYKNLVSGVGSWEGVGSPTRFVGEVTTGLRDFVVMPYEGIFRGPSGFFVGIGKGCSSMVKHIAAGTLNSLTNGAWTWSRNLDALTQDDEDRRADIHGITDGVTQGFTSLGVRMLGAIGGIAHYPIQAVINNGASPSSIVSGVAKGMASVVTKPVGGALELLAMTGEGILKGTGWSHHNKTKFQPVSESMPNANYAMLKYQRRLIPEEHEENVLLVADASQKSEDLTETFVPVALILSDENVYVYSVTTDSLVAQVSLKDVKIIDSDDKNLLSLRVNSTRNQNGPEYCEDRVMDFVLGFSGTEEHQRHSHVLLSKLQSSTSTTTQHSSDGDLLGNFYLDHSSKAEFVSLLYWLQKVISGEIFKVN